METIYKKIRTVDELKSILAKKKKEGKKIVHCHGVFDLIHPGHIRHLAAAKKEGDILVVTITADRFVRRGPGRPVFNENLRAETLAAIGSVDFVAIDHNPVAVNTIKKIKPDVYVKGQEYEKKEEDLTGKIYDEEEAIKSVGGRLAFTHDITFSSSKLINDHLEVFPAQTREYLRNISKKYPINLILDRIKSAKKLKALVIGDAIIDQYHYCESMGRSLKEHLVVSKYLSEETFPGGVFATANNSAEICGQVDLISVLGENDPFEDYVRNSLRSNIESRFFFRKFATTTVKRRIVQNVSNQKLAQVCYMDDSPLPDQLEQKILKHLERVIPKYDLVIVSDFGHGLMNNKMIDLLTKRAKFLALNVQTNSANTGFNLATKYPCSDYVSIDEPEIRLAARDKHGALEQIVKNMLKKLHCKNLMVTRGHQGSLNYQKKGGFHSTPAFASNVVDAIGAGDAFFAFTAPLMALGLPRDLTCFIGNAVGALAVQIVCNRQPVNAVDLMKYITRLLK